MDNQKHDMVHENHSKKDRDSEIENSIIFLNSIMGKATGIILHFDTQTNILIGISTAISAFAISNIKDGSAIFSTLAFFSIISLAIGLYAVHPPKFLRKKGQRESLLYNRKISGFKDSREYAEEIKKTIDNKDSIIEEYSNEIYNIYKYHYRPKRVLFKISRDFLIAGILISVLVAILQ
jgi:hypothetical protein